MCVLLYIEVTILTRCCGGARLWNPSAQEVEAGELLQVQGQPGLHNDYSVLQLWVPGTELRSSGLVAGPFIHGDILWPAPSLFTELLIRRTCQDWVEEKLLCLSKSAWSLACPHASVHSSWVYRATHRGWEMECELTPLGPHRTGIYNALLKPRYNSPGGQGIPESSTLTFNHQGATMIIPVQVSGVNFHDLG